MRIIFKGLFVTVFLLKGCMLSFGQLKLTYQFQKYVDQDSSFFKKVAFAQTKHSRLVDMGERGVALWGCNKALSHLQIQFLTKQPRLECIELSQEIQDYYQNNSLTFGSVHIQQDTVVVVLNESFIIRLVQDSIGRFEIQSIYDAFPVVNHPIKKLHVYQGEYFVVVPEPKEPENDNCDLFTLKLFRLDIQKHETKLFWQKDFLKRFTRNIYFENYFFQDSTFQYFNPLNYVCESISLKSPSKISLFPHANEKDFLVSNEPMLFLQELGNKESNIKQFINISHEGLVKDYIKLIYPCKEGYLIWRTNYPKKKSYSLDWISNDLKHIQFNINHSFSYTANDSSEIGSLDNFPITPSGNYIQLLNNYIVVGVHHSGFNYSSSTKHSEIWEEYYKTVGRSFQGQFIMSYYIFNYTLMEQQELGK